MVDYVIFNLGRNPDMVFLSDLVNDALRCKADTRYYTTVSRTEAPNGKIFLKDHFLTAKATSPMQLCNLILGIYWLILNRQSKNVVITSPSFVNIFLIPLSVALRMNAYVFIHDILPHYRGVRGVLYRVQNKVIFSFSRKVYVFSKFSSGQAKVLYPSTKSKVVVLPLPTPAEFHATKSKEVKTYDFVWWGRPEYYKGLCYLPEIAKQLQQQGRNLLVISKIPEDSSVKNELVRINNVELIEAYLPEEELISKLCEARINLCPYVTATQSGIVNYCMCLGIPSAITQVGALPEQNLKAGIKLFLKDARSIDSKCLFEEYGKIDAQRIKDEYYNNYSSRIFVKNVYESIVGA